MRVHLGSQVRSQKGLKPAGLATGLARSGNHRSPQQLEEDLAYLIDDGLSMAKDFTTRNPLKL